MLDSLNCSFYLIHFNLQGKKRLELKKQILSILFDLMLLGFCPRELKVNLKILKGNKRLWSHTQLQNILFSGHFATREG